MAGKRPHRVSAALEQCGVREWFVSAVIALFSQHFLIALGRAAPEVVCRPCWHPGRAGAFDCRSDPSSETKI